MLTRLCLSNFGPLADVAWRGLGPINLVIGGNATGKTFLLKVLYCVLRTLEEYKRGAEKRSAADILADKLYWTFQPEKIGDLVTKGAESPLSLCVECEGREFRCTFGRDTTKQISAIENHVPPRSSNSVFLPAKEVLSLHHLILKSREQERAFGFDDTYLDLARALRQPPQKGKNYAEFAHSRRQLEDLLGGRAEYDEASARWRFKTGNQRFPIGTTAEGLKKIAILDTLLGNRYLDTDSVVFIDEPESALHPTAVSRLLDIVSLLAKRGIQFFLASHSYFVVKKLYLVALENELSVPVLSAEDSQWTPADLKEGMPANPIIDESVRLYEREVEVALS